MKSYSILVFGAGVIGSLYAAKLSESGNNVTILARNKRFDEISNHANTAREELNNLAIEFMNLANTKVLSLLN